MVHIQPRHNIQILSFRADVYTLLVNYACVDVRRYYFNAIQYNIIMRILWHRYNINVLYSANNITVVWLQCIRIYKYIYTHRFSPYALYVPICRQCISV